MDTNPCKLEMYQTSGGRIPFAEWLESLDTKVEAVVNKRLARLAAGNLGDFKFFDTILELRIDYGPGYRIYFGKKDATWVILLTGGTKRTQNGDIEKAREYWTDYKKRCSTKRSL